MTERGALSKGFTGSDDEGGVVAAVPGDSNCENDLQENRGVAKATGKMNSRKIELVMQTLEKTVKMER